MTGRESMLGRWRWSMRASLPRLPSVMAFSTRLTPTGSKFAGGGGTFGQINKSGGAGSAAASKPVPVYTPATAMDRQSEAAANAEFAIQNETDPTAPLDVVEINIADADLLNDDGTLKQSPASDAVASAAAAAASDSADSGSGSGTWTHESLRAGLQSKIAFFRAHNYHHPTLSSWPGHWTTNQHVIIAYRKAQIDLLASLNAGSDRFQFLIKMFFAFKHFDLKAKLHFGYLHKKHDKVLVQRSLWCIHRQSMCKELFDPAYFAIPNDYQGRVIVRCLHLWIVQHKLKTAHGTPMMLQDKTAKQAQKKSFAVMLMLDRCMKMKEEGDPEADQMMLGVLWRNVYGGQCENKRQLRALQSYLIANFAHFQKLTDDEVYCGNLTWAKFPSEPLGAEIEPITAGEFDAPMMERGELVELNPEYR